MMLKGSCADVENHPLERVMANKFVMSSLQMSKDGVKHLWNTLSRHLADGIEREES